MPSFPCWNRFKGTDLHNLLKKRTQFDDPSTPEGKEAYIKAAKEIQSENLDKLHNIYNQVGVKGYETPIEKNVVPDIKQTEGSVEKPKIRVTTQQLENAQPKPEETEPVSQATTEGEAKTTSIKNTVSENIRQTFDLPKVELPKLGSNVQRLAEGKRLVDSGEINPTDVVDKIIKGNGEIGMQPDEAKAMLYYTHQLNTHFEDLQEKRSQAETPEEKEKYTGQIGQLSDLMDAATEANMKAGTPWSDVGQTRQINVDQNFNPSRDKSIIKDAYGGEIPKDVQQKLDGALKERDEAIQKTKDLEEQLKKKEAELQLSQLKKGRTKYGSFKEKRASLLEDLKAAKKEQEDYLKKQGIKKAGAGFTLTGKMVKIVGQLAKTYIDEGLEKLDDIVSKIHDEVKDLLDGISKKDIRDAIALHETEKLETKAKGLEGKTPDDINTNVNKLKLKFQKDSRWVAANQRIKNAEFKIKQMKKNAFDSQKNNFQKGLNWLSRAIRASVLSGVNILYKLGSALTLGSAAKRIPEQLLGGGWSQIYKGIAKQAPIEGFWNAKSEAKFYKEFFNPKKFGQNVYSILKDHEGLLNKQLGEPYSSDLAETTMPGKQKTLGGKIAKTGLDIANRVLLLPTDIHQIIKDPAKRATYESSFRNGMVWAEKNGMDINDPLVRHSLEVAAFKRANYEIFQEHNQLSDWINKKKNDWDNSKNPAKNVGKFLADVVLPVSTVPTNIVRRLASTSPIGLLKGNVEAFNAYRKGIENLSTEEADAIMRHLKQGSLGTALAFIGWFGAAHFGGLYSKYDPNKKRKEGELTSDQMEVNGNMIPKPVQHALPLEIMQLWATGRHIFDNYTNNKDASNFNALYQAGKGMIGAGVEQVPIIETGVHAIESANDPYQAKKFEENIKGRFVPQILKETGAVGNKNDKLQMLKEKYADSEDIFKNNLKVYDKKTGKLLQISDDQFKNYKNQRDKKIDTDIESLYNNGIGNKSFDQLSDDQVKREITYIKDNATRKTKEQMFGKERKTFQEILEERKLKQQRSKLYN